MNTMSNNSPRFSRHLEAFASEYLENLEEILPRYYMHEDIFNKLRRSPNQPFVEYL